MKKTLLTALGLGLALAFSAPLVGTANAAASTAAEASAAPKFGTELIFSPVAGSKTGVSPVPTNCPFKNA